MAEFPSWYATEADKFIDDCPGRTPTFGDLVDYLSVMCVEMHDDIKDKETEFAVWFSRKSKYGLRIRRDWLGEDSSTLTDTTAPTPTTTTANSSAVAAPIRRDATTAISSDGTIAERAQKKLHWYKFMNKLLLEMAIRLGEDYIPIMGDLISHITGQGKQVLPHFSFVVNPREKEMYERVELVLKEVIAYFSSNNIHMSNGLKGSANLCKLIDGRYVFSMSIDPVPPLPLHK